MTFGVRRASSRTGSFDMTPMIDVVMQLLIFFMFTSQFVAIARSPVELPKEKGEQEELEKSPGVVIDVRADGQYLLSSRLASREEIAKLLEAEVAAAGDPAKVQVLVRADREARSSAINLLALELLRLKIRTWRLGTQEPDGPVGRRP